VRECPTPTFTTNGGLLEWAMECAAQNRKANDQLRAIDNAQQKN